MKEVTMTTQQISRPAAPVKAKPHYAELKSIIRDAGLLRSRDRMFWIWATFHVSALILTLGGVKYASANSNTLILIFMTVMTGFIFTQISLIVHDVLHRQAPRRHKRLQKPISLLLGNIGVGLSDDWWEPKHNQHHAQPNHIDIDPDIKSKFFKLDESQLANMSRVERFFARYQHVTFFGLINFQAWSFRQASIQFLMTKKRGKSRIVGLLGIALHFVWLGAFAYTLGLKDGILFVLISQVVFGAYNSSIFASNHKGMPMIQPGVVLDFFTKQVLTARNLKGGWIVWYFTGGLGEQIEHHLFPAMSRFNLPAAQPIVEKFCEDKGVTYVRVGVFESVKQWVGHFKQIAEKA